MSLAHDYSRYGLGAGNTAPALPPEERAPRQTAGPSVRRKSKAGRRMVVMALLWGAVLSVSVFTIYRNTVLQREISQITQAREQLTQLEQQSRELETRLAAGTSVAEVEEWALAHGMVRPKVVRALTPDKTAVVARPATEAVQPAESGRAGFWQSLMQYLGSFTGGEAKAR